MNCEINFFIENIRFLIRKKTSLRNWISGIIIREGKSPGCLNFILCDDEYLSELNVKYLKHSTLTDILTFPAENDQVIVSGDIYISLPRIRENAKKFKQKTERELHRVMIHGILHLLGYKDSTLKEKATMRNKEDHCLSELNWVS